MLELDKVNKSINIVPWIPIEGEHIKPALRIQHDTEEVVEKRTFTSKTYKLGNNKFLTRHGIREIHYEKDGKLEEIDLAFEDRGDHYFIDKAIYTLKIYKGIPKYSYISDKGGKIDVRLYAIDDVIFNDTIETQLLNNNIFYNNAVEGLSLKIFPMINGVSLYKKVEQNGPRKLTWLIKEVGQHAKIGKETYATDNNKNGVRIENKITPNGDEFFFDEILHEEHSEVIDKTSRKKKWMPGVTYPVVIDVDVNEVIAAEIDDVRTFNGGGLQSLYLSAGNFSGYPMNGGVRFRTLAIPQGVTINSAVLTLDVKGDNGDPTLKIYGDDVDNAGSWSGGEKPKDIVKTAANLSWTPTANVGVATTAAITSIVQEIISRTGWSSNNNMKFAILNNGAGFSVRKEFDDFGDASPALLDITYTAVAVDTPQRMMVGFGA